MKQFSSLPCSCQKLQCRFFTVFFPGIIDFQAALATQLFEYNRATGDDASAEFMLQTCILSILLTAPTGQLIIHLLGNKLLKKDIPQLPVIKISNFDGTGTTSGDSFIGGFNIDLAVGLPKIFESESREVEERKGEEEKRRKAKGGQGGKRESGRKKEKGKKKEEKRKKGKKGLK